MGKKLFKRLVESMKQMGEIVDGQRVPSRARHVTPQKVPSADRALSPPDSLSSRH